MAQENSATSSQPEPPSQANAIPIEDTQESLYSETMNGIPFFPVTGKITFKPMTAAPKAGAWDLPPSVARLVSVVSLGAVLLWPLSGCSSTGDSIPCLVPSPTASAATPVPDGTPTATCTTRGGTHYVWIHSRGGWVQSNDGVHPNPGSHGVGGDDGHSGSNGHGGFGGDGHGGSDSG